MFDFIRKNKDMTLSEFKWIWHMEFGHRMWGRLIGAAFLIPATIFWARGMLGPGMKPRIIAYGSLIAFQVRTNVIFYRNKQIIDKHPSLVK